jgi:hypothetical protein
MSAACRLAFSPRTLRRNGARLREVEGGVHLFLYRLEGGCRPLPRAREVDGDLKIDPAGLTAQHNDTVRKGHRLIEVMRNQDQREAGFFPKSTEMILQL